MAVPPKAEALVRACTSWLRRRHRPEGGWRYPEHGPKAPGHVRRVGEARCRRHLSERRPGDDRSRCALKTEPGQVRAKRNSDRLGEGVHETARREAHLLGQCRERDVCAWWQLAQK